LPVLTFGPQHFAEHVSPTFLRLTHWQQVQLLI
jgi:hypothetical protein